MSVVCRSGELCELVIDDVGGDNDVGDDVEDILNWLLLRTCLTISVMTRESLCKVVSGSSTRRVTLSITGMILC